VTSIKASSVLPRHPAFAPAAATRAHIASQNPALPVMRAQLALDRGDLLCISDGRGMRLTPASGVLWITEEQDINDTILKPGDAHRIKNSGLALVLAHRPGRVVLEVPAGVSPPRSVDLAAAEGEPGRRIALAWSKPFSRPVWAAVAAAVRKAVAAGRELWRRRHAPTPTEDSCRYDFLCSSRRVRFSQREYGADSRQASESSAPEVTLHPDPCPYY
jgi:hypothetical protein